jgi:two-component system, LuxR family, response regulator FixJ
MNPDKSLGPVFVVDDDESVGKSLVRLLVLEGYKAESFLSARRFLDSVPFDAKGCVVSDIYMPDIDGFALQQMMHQLGYRMPVIFISAHAKAGDREVALERGAAGFLVKPYDEKSLLEMVHKVTC